MTNPQPSLDKLSPREAAQLAQQLEAARAAGLAPGVSMTAEQFRQFKQQLWWGREFYSGLGLTHMFPGLGTKRSFATKLAQAPASVDPGYEDGGHASLAAGFGSEAESPTSPAGVDGVVDGQNAPAVGDQGGSDGAAGQQENKE